MELALSLGHAPKPFSLFDKPPTMPTKDPGFSGKPAEGDDERRGSSDPPLQLDLLPFAPVPRPRPSSHPRIPWLSDARKVGIQPRAGAAVEDADHVTAVSSPNSNSASSFQMDLCFGNSNESRNKKEHECEADQRGSDDEENGSTRKKLRLSKQQSAFLEESFKLHPTLNPKQKVALAKYLNLRPRQVEVWFQNRRARTKLKQTEVDCEYLKRCCETLTEENKRLHKELQELRALKTTQPFYMQLPATTLTMCPSCERVATNSSSALPVATPNQPTSVTTSHDASPVQPLVSLTKTTVVPFDKGEDHAQQDQPPNPAS